MAEEAVRSPATGRVIDVPVGAGAAVREGQEMLVLESMKMEIPVLAPRDAVVAALRVAPGAAVREGDVLLTIRLS